MSKVLITILSFCSLFLIAQSPDLILYNGKVFTAESADKNITAIAIQNGKILRIGSDTILKLQGPKSKLIDLGGKFCMPGLIEGHGHMEGLGESLTSINLLGIKTWQDAISSVNAKIPSLGTGEWLEGRGWHQEKWDKLPELNYGGYPVHNEISKVSPNNPVLLYHASGHALLANAKAMELAKIDRKTQDPPGGKIIKDQNGEPTGIFEENAMELFSSVLLKESAKQNDDTRYKMWQKRIEVAQDACLKTGITSFHDAGVSVSKLSNYKTLADNDGLKIRMWVMIYDTLNKIRSISNRLPIIGYHENFLTIRAIKQYIDGALGSYGAWLLKPYTDKAGFKGQNVLNLYSLKEFADFAFSKNLQLCVHAIGDKGNQEVLNLYESVFRRDPKNTDLRWRIEHAQHVSTKDIPRFGKLGVIASMQAIHCTSDAPFVAKRLGDARAKSGSYAWRSLLDSGAKLANGTDTPVEKINPFECIYAAVTRKRIDNGMEFYSEQKMTREESLLSYTLWNAYAGFEEDIKGSIKPGKLADIIVTDTDLLNCDEEKIPQTKVLMTILDGKIVYQQNN